jgi:probable HAF family extracellular repeat protein
MKMKQPLLYVALACILVATAAFADDQLTIKCSDVKVAVAGALETDSYAVNNKMAIAGDYVDSAGVQHGMILKGKTLTKFDGPSGSTSIAAYGINTAGVVVGWYLDTTGTPRAFSYAKGKFTTVAFPGAVNTEANGINDSGWIDGSYADTAGVTHGFYWDTKKYHSIDVAGAALTTAWSINNNKLMTVFAINSSGTYDGYLYDGTKFTLMDVPGATSSVIHGINNKQDLNYTIFDSSGNRHGVLFQKSTGVFTQFDDPKGTNTTRADGINDTDVMVGRYSPASGKPPSAGFKCTVK